MLTGPPVQRHWLDRYANNHHAWEREDGVGNSLFKRPVGLVEGSFDADGVFHGGRADLHSTLTLEARSALSEAQLRKRIIQAWAILRLQHPLLHSHVQGDLDAGQQRWFVVRQPADAAEAVTDAENSVISLQSRSDVDVQDLLKHVLNTGRIIQPSKSLSRLFIFPLQPLPNGNLSLRLMQISAHMITDGLSSYNSTSHFIDLLNQTHTELEVNLRESVLTARDPSQLPPAQEDLYPQVPGNLARQRWFWVIVRILRHIRKPLPSGFMNPLRRKERSTIDLEQVYPDVLDYSSECRPPLISGYCSASLSSSSSRCLHRLCWEAKASVGAGCFALVGLVMMELEEQIHPQVPLAERSPFVGSFPLNPRPLFNYHGPYDSCMLAFSDGLVLPFLPSNTSLARRFRLLARSAHRQLKSYQKKLRGPKKGLDPHNPLRMVASNYLTAIELAEAKIPEQHRNGINPQGAYPANWSFSSATCGVSSVGSVKQWVAPGKFSLEIDGQEKDLAADFRSVRMGVRARDNEFLVGSMSDDDGNIQFAVSYDASAMDEGLVERWKEKIEMILEQKDGSKL